MTVIEKRFWTEGIKEGEKRERERIIKLVEQLAYIDRDGHEMIGEFKSDLIALIKGDEDASL